MLQQILRDMWVDPEILAELDEAQKQTLFCKMREEQVRRWKAWDQKLGSEEPDRPNAYKGSRKQVQFMKGEDGEPWVWVMGEHPDDKSIDTILTEEARQRAVSQAREEAHQLRKSVEKELTQLIDYKPLDSLEQKFELSPKSIEALDENLEIYCTVDELRQRIEELEPRVEHASCGDGDDQYCDELKLDINKNTLHFNFIEGKREALQDLGPPKASDGVSLRVAAWERRVAAARAGELLRGLRARRARALRDAQLHAQDGDDAWREQERKAKEAEAAMRSIARAARAAHRRSADAPADDDAKAGKPSSRAAALEWFRVNEQPRGVGLDDHGKPVDWFHGLITRADAEHILSTATTGSFLVRVSERVWGYALSLRARGQPRHYLVETAPRGYRLLPAGLRTFESLAELINYHKRIPITEEGGELLKAACPPAQPPAIL